MSKKNTTADYSEKAQQHELAAGNLEINKSGRKFFQWIQEFSKKIVTITFVIFVIINIYSLVLVTFSYFTTYDLTTLSVLLTETHTTFRDVIGGYIIKAAAENSIKIIGSIIDKYYENKYASVPATDSEDTNYSEDPQAN